MSAWLLVVAFRPFRAAVIDGTNSYAIDFTVGGRLTHSVEWRIALRDVGMFADFVGDIVSSLVGGEGVAHV